ncbi:MAG: hypothetical protein PHE84_01875 [bacterium]|nr:hypothetical protein [bacterium]
MDQFAEKDDIGPVKVPNRGKSRVLVIPVDFNLPGLTPQNIGHLQRFFGPAREDVPTFAGYFRDNSRGRLEIEARVMDPITISICPFPGLGIFSCRVDPPADPALFSWLPVVNRVLRDLANRGLDFSDFDLNGSAGIPDGWIDGLIITQNGISTEASFPLSLLAPEIIKAPTRINAVTIVDNSIPPDGDYTRNDAAILHGFGHLLGFAELSDPDRSSPGLLHSLMGTYCDDGNVCDIPLLDAYSRVAIGWTDEYLIHGTEEIRVPPAPEANYVARLGDASPYLLVENRGRLPLWDRRIESRGLAVYRVDPARLPPGGKFDFFPEWISGGANRDDNHPLVRNILADSQDLFLTGNSLGSAQLSPFPEFFYPDGQVRIAVSDIDSETYTPWVRARLRNGFTEEPAPQTEGCQTFPVGASPTAIALILILGLFNLGRRSARHQ